MKHIISAVILAFAIALGCVLVAQVPIGGNGTGGGSSTVAPFIVTRTSATVLDVSAGTVRIGNTTPCTLPAATITLGSGTGAIWVYVSSACVMTVASNVTIGSCTNCTAVVGTAYADSGFAVITWVVTAGAFASTGTSAVNDYDFTALIAGTNIQITCTSGVCTIDAFPSGGVIKGACATTGAVLFQNGTADTAACAAGLTWLASIFKATSVESPGSIYITGSDVGIYSGNFSVGSAARYGFSTNGFFTGTVDAAITRSAAAIIKVTDGSTGTGTTITKVPTSCAAMATGTLWNNAGVAAFCP